MKFFLLPLLAFFSFSVACEPSGIAKKEMERFSGTPTPTILPPPTPLPIDPAHIVQIDTAIESEPLGVNGYQQRQAITCTKYNNVKINGSESTLTIKGVCKQVMVNGDRNKIAADAASEYVFNGTANELTYSRFVNGRWPSVIENLRGNTVEHRPAATKDARATQDKK